MRHTFLTATLALAALVTTNYAAAQPHTRGTVTTLTLSDDQSQDEVDYVNARPMDLPLVPARSTAEAVADLVTALTAGASSGTPGHSPGGLGNGALHPMNVGAPAALREGGIASATADGIAGDVISQEYGTYNHPFTTARGDLGTLATNTSYPYRASGKLFFTISGSTYVCSASLIKKGVIVTAAHCVSAFGTNKFYSGWRFIPGYRNGAAPYGTWTAKKVAAPSTYLNGTDPCASAGVICQNDVAVIVLAPQSGAYPGTSTGWYGYAWDGYGFTGGLTQITQVGYPNCLNSGAYMERNDSYGYVSASYSDNTVIGSLMCGGSSGGPWLVNFGTRPALTGTTAGAAAMANAVVGVTSWGYVDSGPKEMGGSPFLSTNIGVLVPNVCTAVPAAC